MNSSDVESIAVHILEENVFKYHECLETHIVKGEKTPFWDGSIWLYSDKSKTTNSFVNRIDIQLKGRHVKRFKSNNSFTMDIKYLKGYQKEIKGTLLFVVDFIDIDTYKIYFCNLLPVDLKLILSGIRENQKSVSLKLKEINEFGVLNLKNVCVGFYKNSQRQANKRIIDESEFGNIEEFNIEIPVSSDEYQNYLETADIYTYAKLKNSNEEVATIKGTWESYSVINKKVSIGCKEYYAEFTIRGNSMLIIGPVTIDLNKGTIQTKITGSPRKRIKDISFIIELLKKQYVIIDKSRIELTIKDTESHKIDIKNLKMQLAYYNKIVKVFKYFNTEFDMDYSLLDEFDLKNLHLLMNLYDGKFPDKVKELQKYNIKINKYKFIFILLFNDNRIINFYSTHASELIQCFINENGQMIKTSLYLNLTEDDYMGISNFDEKIVLKSFNKLEYCDEVIDSIELIVLNLLNSYDKIKCYKYLKLADDLNQYACIKRCNDIDIINSKQIKMRKNVPLSINDKNVLFLISEKNENKGDYSLLCCIDILLNNKYMFEKHYSQMNQEDRKTFNSWPICNFINNN